MRSPGPHPLTKYPRYCRFTCALSSVGEGCAIRAQRTSGERRLRRQAGYCAKRTPAEMRTITRIRMVLCASAPSCAHIWSAANYRERTECHHHDGATEPERPILRGPRELPRCASSSASVGVLRGTFDGDGAVVVSSVCRCNPSCRGCEGVRHPRWLALRGEPHPLQDRGPGVPELW